MGKPVFTDVAFRAAFPKAVRGEAISEPSYVRAHITALLQPDGTPRIIASHNADRAAHPASLVKLALFYIAYDLMDQGSLRAEDRLRPSARARKIAQPTSGLSDICVGDALKVMAVASCNDLAVALAEYIAGSEWKFVQRYMRPLTQQLNLRQTEFRNATGLPMDQSIYHGSGYILPDNVSTAGDLLTLGAALIYRHPQFLTLSAQQSVTVDHQTYISTNHLLRQKSGEIGQVDGLKTGSLMACGYHLAATATKDGQRLLSLTLGAPAPDMRFTQTAELLRSGFRSLQPV